MDDNFENALDHESCDAKLTDARREKVMEIPKNGDWTDVYSGTLS
jgi:hypothetical protein